MEFVLVGVLVVTVFLGVLQVALYLHVRNVVVASVAEGAREAANADRDCADGAARAYDLVARSVGTRVADGLRLESCDVVDHEGVPVVRLSVSGEVPLLLPLPLRATAHAVEEAP